MNKFLVGGVLVLSFWAGYRVGAWRWLSLTQSLGEGARGLIGQLVLTGRLVAPADRRESSQRLTLLPDGETAKVLVVAPLYPPYSYGQRLRVSGRFAKPENFTTQAGQEFDYLNFLQADGIMAVSHFAKIEKVDGLPGVSLRSTLFWFKQKIVDGLNRSLPEPEASLAAGLIVGAKQSLGADWLEIFRRAGLTHIVVLSGYNLAIVALALAALFRRFPLRWRLGASWLAIILFTLMTGAEASTSRAALMASFTLLARFTHHSYQSGRALIIALALMVLWNPLSLLHDPGFQLSFLATAGIIYLAPIIERWLARYLRPSPMREIMITSWAAQLAVAPWLLYLLHQLPLIAIVSNLLVLPLVPSAMTLAGLVAFLSFFLPTLILTPVAWLAYLNLKIILLLTSWLALVPGGIIDFSVWSFWVTMALYSMLAGGALFLTRRYAVS